MATSKQSGMDQSKEEVAMKTPPVVSQQEWEAARQQLLVKKKTLTRSRAPIRSPTWPDLRLPFPRPGSGFFAVAAIPAARSFAIRLMSFTGTGLLSGKWTVPFRSS